MDAELRGIERAVEATGDPAARLALARLLERLGRSDEAFQALWPGRTSAEVRPALAERPAPIADHPDGGWWDVPPLRVRPRVRWQRRVVTDGLLGFETFALVASPLGICCCPERSRVVVLDPDDGMVRWHGRTLVAERARPLRVEGERLVVATPGGEALFDLWSGRREGTRTAEAPSPRREWPGWLLETPRVQLTLQSDASGRGDLVLRDRATQAAHVLATRVYDFGALAAARDVLFSFVWQLEDEAVHPATRAALRAHDEAGRLLWELDEPQGIPVATMAIAPLGGRLYALGQDGSVLCLEA